MSLIIPAGKGGKLKRTETVALNAAGDGEVILGPVPASRRWVLARLAVFCTDDDPMPVASVYDGTASPGNLIDATYTGAQDVSDMGGLPLDQSEFLTVRWTGGQALAVATVRLTGYEVVPE